MHICMAENEVGRRDKGRVTAVPLHAHDPVGPHIHHLASALRVRTPHSVEILATDGTTVDPDDAHTPLSRPPCVFVHRILLKSTQGEDATNNLVVNPFRAPEPLPILNPSSFVPKNGFPVVKGLRSWAHLRCPANSL